MINLKTYCIECNKYTHTNVWENKNICKNCGLYKKNELDKKGNIFKLVGLLFFIFLGLIIWLVNILKTLV